MSSTAVISLKQYERLPKNVIPSFYRLKVTPDLEKFTFTGKVDIDVTVNETTDVIIINCFEIVIGKATFNQGSIGPLQGQVSYDNIEKKASIKFDAKLSTGPGVLSLAYTGILNDKMVGFYRSKYKKPNGEERYGALTQFAATDTRRAFPCWDEPSFKAKFEVTIVAPKDRTVLSNTDPVKDVPHPENPNLKIVTFAQSPLMSTYLLAFIIGDYEYVETTTKRNTRVRVYTPLGKRDQGGFALEVASKSLTLFEDYFDIPFPLGKLDHVAVADFAYHAMENWGLITYREMRIISDPVNTSTTSKEAIALTVAHETAHQWFGNLVTMKWWTDLWLNEGFATFCQFLATDKIFPHFDIWSQFVATAELLALQTDSLRHSHPIEVPVNHPDDIDSIFDLISYEKGASVIRMCHNWIGDEAFRKGLNQYLSKHAYGNAVTQDLWDSWEAASDKPVGKMMPTWTKQLGYPVIKVESRQEGANCILKLSQSKFSIDGSLTEDEKKMIWMIPISVITTKDSIAASTLMTTAETELIVPNVSADDWIKLNPKVMGFYRVDYSSKMLNCLKSAIATKQLTPVDRLQVINDSFALAMAGHVSTRVVLSLLESYVNEDDYVTWCAIDSGFGKLSLLLSYTDLSDKLNSFGIKLYSKVFEKLGFDSKDEKAHTENLLRTLILNRLVSFKYEPVLKEAHLRFKGHINGKPIHPDVRNCVYRAVASSCDNETFNAFFKLHKEADLIEEKLRLVQCMGATCDPTRMRQVLQFTLSDEVRSQDAWLAIIAIAGSKLGRSESWKFFKENAVEFKRRYGSHYAIVRLIENVINGFVTEEEAKDVEDFFNKNHFSGQEVTIARGLDWVKAHINWMKREVGDLTKFFKG